MKSNISLGGAVSNIVRVGEIAARGAAAVGGVTAGVVGTMAGRVAGMEEVKPAQAAFSYGVDQGNKAVSQFKGMFH